MPQPDPNDSLYKTLQVDPEAEPEVIAAAYKRLAIKYHPDTNKSPDAAHRMRAINVAYEILGDPERRRQYDRQRAAEISHLRAGRYDSRGGTAERTADKAPIWQQIGIEMVTIPAGEFLYGEENQKIFLPEYRLARTPVTNAQYKHFVDVTGYRLPDHWQYGQIPAGKDNHPVVTVSWEDAEVFCEWVGARLPTEQEWEKGSRGTGGRTYPWGTEWRPGRCNSAEANISDTTPVDRYLNGASPYGLLVDLQHIVERI